MWMAGHLADMLASRSTVSRTRGRYAIPSAELKPGTEHGWRVEGGLRAGPDRDGQVFALFGRHSQIIGWTATVDGRPSPDLPPKGSTFLAG